MGQDNVVGTATLYKLYSPRIESQCGQDFLRPSKLTLGSFQPPVQWVTHLFPESKAAREWH